MRMSENRTTEIRRSQGPGVVIFGLNLKILAIVIVRHATSFEHKLSELAT